MKFHEMVFTLQVDHKIIETLLNSIARSDYKTARKKLIIFRQLLINHFLVEELVLYPFVKQNFFGKDADGRFVSCSLSSTYDFASIMQGIEIHNAVGMKVVEIISECMDIEESLFQKKMTRMATLIRERVAFEETRLFKYVDTSRVILLRKSDFARLRIEE